MKSSTTEFQSGAGTHREKFFEAFLADARDGFMMLDNSLRIVHFSPAYDHYHYLHTGIHLKDGKLLSDLTPADGMFEIMPYVQRAMAGEEVKFAMEYPPVEGTIYKYEVHYAPLMDRGGDIIGIKAFVHELGKKITPAFKSKGGEDLYKTLIQNAADVFQLTGADFELQYVSDSVKNILGYYPAELIGTNGLDMVHADDRNQVQEWLRKVKSEKDKFLIAEYRVKNKSGQYIWIENSGRKLPDNPHGNAIAMSYRNIQLKKMADYALVQAEHRLSLLLNNTEESFIILNSRLKIIAYNRAAQEHSPYFFRQELQSNLSILDLVGGAKVETMINLFEKVFDGEEVVRETEIADAKNQVHIFNHTYRPLFNEQKDIFGVFITSTDITERKLAERQVKESEIRFKTIIGESFDAILITNVEGNIFYVSPSITNVLGYSEEELIGIKGLHLAHDEDKAIAVEKIHEAINDPSKETNVDIRMVNNRGEYIWVEAKTKNMFQNPYVGGVLISIRDISARKQAEEMIASSETRFKGLVQSGADMISIVDEKSILQYASPTLKSVMGIDPSARYGKSIFTYVHPEDVAGVKQPFYNFLQGANKKVSIGPYRLRNDDGDYSWIESTITNFLDDPAIAGIVFNSHDITETKKLAEDLAANAERLKNAQKVAKLGYLEYDLSTNTYFCSEQFYDIIAIPPHERDDITFSTIENIIHPDDLERFRKEVSKAKRGIREFNDEYRIVLKDGTRKVVLAMGGVDKTSSGNSSKLSLTLQDITDSKMAMLALQTMEDRFRSLFENSIDGVIMSIPEGAILSANPAFCQMVGYTLEEILMITADELLDRESEGVIRLRDERKKTGYFTGEITIKHKEGHNIPAEITSIIMTDAHGELYYSTIVRDITEKKKIELEQQSLTRELLKNNQDLQQFSFITSHNLRAPVANLISLLSLYNKQNLADDFNAILIDKFEEATRQLNQTLNDLIDVLVIKSNTNVEKQPLHFTDVFLDVKLNIENLLSEQHGKIEADFTALDTIEYNKIHLESIFLNLISNAIRYRSLDRAPHIKIRSYKQDDWAVVEFEDNGLGIDLKRYGDRMFGLYQRFHNSKEGKGLGLYMVKSQIMAMGGKIEVESEPGKGTTFKVYFKL